MTTTTQLNFMLACAMDIRKKALKYPPVLKTHQFDPRHPSQAFLIVFY